MQVEFAYAASSATVVAPCNMRCGGSAGTGGAAASLMSASPAGTDVRPGHDDKTGRPRQFLACGPTGAGMTIGMQLARPRSVASTVFVTDRRTRAGVIVDDRAVRVWGSSAGPAEAACSDAAFSDGAGGENGPKKGVTAYDAELDGRQAVRPGVAAYVAGS